MVKNYISSFIISGEPLPIKQDEQSWLMRQPSPEEMLDGVSAFRLTYNKVMNDTQLIDRAENDEALKNEATYRGLISKTMYMLPLLIQDHEGEQLYNVLDSESLDEFEEFAKNNPDILVVWSEKYLEYMAMSDETVKKK